RCHRLVHKRVDDVMLASEIIGDVAYADPKLIGQRPHRHCTVAMLVEHAPGRLQNQFSCGDGRIMHKRSQSVRIRKSGLTKTNGPANGRADVCAELVLENSILALASCFRLFLALYTGFFVMLAFSHLSQDAGTRALALESSQSALQGFVFPNTDFRHLY